MIGVADVIPSLISHGADINSRTIVDNQITPLMEAAWFGHVDSVRCLLELGANPSLKNKPGMDGGGGMTARDYAVEDKHQDVVDMLDKWAESHNKG